MFSAACVYLEICTHALMLMQGNRLYGHNYSIPHLMDSIGIVISLSRLNSSSS